MAEDRLLELLQGRARLDAELVDEQPPRLAIDLERLGLATRAVQRLHERRPEPLAERVLADEHLDLTDELCEAAEREVGVEPPLEGRQAELFESEHLQLRERFVGEVGERRPAPEIESFAQSLRRKAGRRLLRLLDQHLEAEQVELVRADADHVARLLRDDRVVRGECLAELGDVVLQRVGGCPGRLRAPELVDEPVRRDDLVRMRQKEREKRPLPRAAEREHTALLDDLERSQDAELHVFSSGGRVLAAPTLTPVVGSAEAQRCLSTGVDDPCSPPAA